MSEQTDIQKLAEEICGWLELRRSTLERIFCEGLVTYAAAKCLVRLDYDVSAEENLSPCKQKYLSYDLVARIPARSQRALVFEIKLLKTRDGSATPIQPFERISDDIYKLCSLSLDQWSPYLVLGHRTSTTIYKKLQAESGKEFYLPFSASDAQDGIAPSPRVANRISVNGILGCHLLPFFARSGDMAVSIFRVSPRR